MKRKAAAAVSLVLVLVLAGALLWIPAAVATPGSSGFEDVDPDAWYASAVTWCAERDIVKGTSETRFSPDTQLSRAMFATMLHRAEGTPAAERPAQFPDCLPDSWYSQAVSWAAAAGILKGYDSGRFGPEDPVTREMTAVILWRRAGQPAGGQTGAPDAGSVSSWAVQAVNWAAEKQILRPRDSGNLDPRAPATRAEAAYAMMSWKQLPEENPDHTGTGKVLVAYFSATGTTRRVAEMLAQAVEGDLGEIRPAQPYTSADMNYTSTDCRANREQNDPDARPEMAEAPADLESYDTIFLGYPIWWGRAPKIMLTFLESGDFGGKTLIPFCTSGSSGFTGSDSLLREAAPDAIWREGARFSSGATAEEVARWGKAQSRQTQQKEEQDMKIRVSDGSREVIFQLNGSSPARSLYRQLPLTVKVENYSDNEKIFYPEKLDTSSPVNADARRGTLAYFSPWGDVVMYYKDFGSYSGLYELGQAISGVEEIQNLSGTIQVTRAD